MERKDFFRKGILQAFKKVVDTTEEVYDIIHDSVAEKKSQPEVVDDVVNNNEYLPKLPGISKAKKINRNLKFPPGAIEKEKFFKKCTGCGDCIQACPYNTLFPVFDSKLEKNFPYLDPNMNACMLCFDYPCIAACEENALKPLKKKETLKLGQAKSLVEHCINTRTGEDTCNACRTSCPIEKVVSYNKNFQPRFSKDCTGCGICVQACPTFPRAIVIK